MLVVKYQAVFFNLLDNRAPGSLPIQQKPLTCRTVTQKSYTQ